jgi:NADPH-dependent glutamate synthase beta subunit-like oxidoreductase
MVVSSFPVKPLPIDPVPSSGGAPLPGAPAAGPPPIPGYAECHLCSVVRKRAALRCRGCVGRHDLRDRLVHEAEAPRRRRVGAILSLVLPGAGHAYAGQPGAGCLFFVIMATGIAYLTQLPVEMNSGRWTLVGALVSIWVLAALDVARGHAPARPPCQEACPAHLAILPYVNAIRDGKFRQSLEQIQHLCPLPASIGRVCHHPCEKDCRRGTRGDPIAICTLKRFVADGYHGEPEEFYRAAAPPSPVHPERVAVVGAGPSGLSAALVLRIMGFGVTLFETEQYAGGMPAAAIPDYRLPQEVYQREVAGMLAAGVDFRPGRRLGRDFSLADLQAEGFAAAYLALGAQRTVRLPHCGKPEEGFVDGIEFLRGAKLGTAGRLAGDVLVIGGGNVAMDVAKTALRLGGASVRVIFLETRETMPAHRWECEEALEEGVILIPASSTVSFEIAAGRVASVLCKRVQRIELDEQRRIRPVLWEGTDFTLPVSTVITAVGSGPDFGFLKAPPPRTPLPKGVFVRELPAQEGVRIPVYYGGDLLTGPASVIQAIAAGYQAAAIVYRKLGKVQPLRAPAWNRARRVRFTGYTDTPDSRSRKELGYRDPAERCANFCEVCNGYPEPVAVAEAARCLRCRWVIAKPPAKDEPF